MGRQPPVRSRCATYGARKDCRVVQAAGQFGSRRRVPQHRDGHVGALAHQGPALLPRCCRREDGESPRGSGDGYDARTDAGGGAGVPSGARAGCRRSCRSGRAALGAGHHAVGRVHDWAAGVLRPRRGPARERQDHSQQSAKPEPGHPRQQLPDEAGGRLRQGPTRAEQHGCQQGVLVAGGGNQVVLQRPQRHGRTVAGERSALRQSARPDRRHGRQWPSEDAAEQRSVPAASVAAQPSNAGAVGLHHRGWVVAVEWRSAARRRGSVWLRAGGGSTQHVGRLPRLQHHQRYVLPAGPAGACHRDAGPVGVAEHRTEDAPHRRQHRVTGCAWLRAAEHARVRRAEGHAAAC